MVGLSKIVKDLQTITKSNTHGNGKMCKRQWNCINDDCKEIFNYHKGIDYNISYEGLLLEKQNHLPKQFNENYYHAIEVFQKKKKELMFLCM